MLLMLLLSSSSRIFALRSFSSGLRFLLVICFPSCLMSLFYTLLWRFTQNLGRSQLDVMNAANNGKVIGAVITIAIS